MATAGLIPRIIHQTWRDAEPPPAMAALAQTWRAHHPDWQYRLWTDADNRALIARAAPEYLRLYDVYPEPIMRADAFRYFLMGQEGGIYADLDLECLGPLDELVRGEAALLALEPDEHLDGEIVRRSGLGRVVSNAFLASPPGHPFWQHVRAELAAAAGRAGPLEVAGPFFLTRALESWRGSAPVVVLAARTVNPVPKRRVWAGGLDEPGCRARLRDEGALAVHHWMGTWVRPPSS